MDPLHWVDEQLESLRQADLCRELPPPLGSAGPTCQVAGHDLINFASNDYLGLAADTRLVAAAQKSLESSGMGRGASPLICGRAPEHLALEQQLAQFEQTEAALLFATGFAANAGTIPALVDQGDAIYGDAYNHASIIDGCRLSRAEKHIYPHNDIEALARLLKQHSSKYRRQLIVTDTLFSMGGDFAPLPQLGELAAAQGAMLMVDEAHATGVFGAGGRGVLEHFAADHPELHQQVQVRVGTLSKALGAAGGFVCGSQALIDWLANRARAYVFSTAQPAATSAAASAALNLVAAQPSTRQQLLQTAAQLRQQLQEQGWDIGDSASQIIPLRVGPAEQALRWAGQLREYGCWVPAIRPPSVPADQSLLRLSVTTAHNRQMLAQLVEALAAVRKSD